MSSGIPFGQGSYNRSPFSPTGPSLLPEGTSLPIDWRAVSPDYFRTMGIPLLAGREFDDRDVAGSPEAVIVSRATARKFWGRADPIGKMLHRPTASNSFTVVGVVGDVRHTSLNEEFPCLYFPAATRGGSLMDVVMRTYGRPESALVPARLRVHALDPELPVSNVKTMEEYVRASAAQPRLNAALLAIFAGVALLIAAVGVYGVLAYSVNQRAREIGLRMALGAQRSKVLRDVAVQGLRMAALGIAAGLAGSYALSRVLSSLLFETPARDPRTFVTVALLLAAVAVIASVAPARRASRVDPMVALRDD
jgi:putative ABC transport system permease protein